MRILVCAGYAPSLANFRGPLLEAMVAQGHEVYACAPENDAETIERLDKMGVKFVQIPLKRTGRNPLGDFRTLAGLVRVIRRIAPDVFLGYTVKPVVYGSMAARIAGVPRIYSLITGLGYSFMGDTLGQRATGVLVRKLYEVALALNRGVFFQNGDDQALFRELGILGGRASTYVVNGSGIDLTRFPLRPLHGLGGGTAFLLIARLISEKGIYEYVEAARRLKARHPQARFQILGGVEDRPGGISLKEIAAWEAEGAIEYLGEVRDVRPHLDACHVYVLPSYREGTPRTVLEAMATGRPIVTTQVPGCRQTVDEGVNGYLVEAKSPDALERAMERFLLEPQLIEKLGRQSRAIAEERFEVNRVNRQMLSQMELARST